MCELCNNQTTNIEQPMLVHWNYICTRGEGANKGDFVQTFKTLSLQKGGAGGKKYQKFANVIYVCPLIIVFVGDKKCIKTIVHGW